jgi:formylglycine-generating enzyme required for sulfatase activity
VASGTAPGTAVYNSAAVSPAAVNNDGGLSAYGTMGQNGNVWEWNESATDGSNSSGSEDRVFRGSDWVNAEVSLRSSTRGLFGDPNSTDGHIGFRVASVPEPSSVVASLVGLGVLAARRRRQRA